MFVCFRVSLKSERSMVLNCFSIPYSRLIGRPSSVIFRLSELAHRVEDCAQKEEEEEEELPEVRPFIISAYKFSRVISIRLLTESVREFNERSKPLLRMTIYQIFITFFLHDVLILSVEYWCWSFLRLCRPGFWLFHWIVLSTFWTTVDWGLRVVPIFPQG